MRKRPVQFSSLDVPDRYATPSNLCRQLHVRVIYAASLHSRRVTKNRFQLEKFCQPRLAPFPSVARLFVTSETPSEVHSRIVDVHVARANLFRHPAGAFNVP